MIRPRPRASPQPVGKVPFAIGVAHLELGLLTRDESGPFRQAQELVEMPSGPLGHHVVQFRRMMMQLAADSLDCVPREEREVASLTLRLADEQLAQLRSHLRVFRAHCCRNTKRASARCA